MIIVITALVHAWFRSISRLESNPIIGLKTLATFLSCTISIYFIF